MATNNDPSIPPAEKPLNRGKRCCCCLLQCFWVLLVLIIVFVCLVILVLYILIQPRSFKFHVTEAKLTQFNYSDNTNTLHYNLVLNFTARNPNKKLKIYYDVVEANALYQDYMFSTTDVNMPWRSYLQNKKGTDRMSAVFSGRHAIALDHDQVSEFNEDLKVGVVRIDIKINFKIRFRLGDLQSGYFYPKAKCELKVPFSSNEKTVVDPFHPAKCQVDF